MTIGQKGLWYLSQVSAQTSAAYNVVLALQTAQLLDAALLSQALDAVVARHSQLSSHIVMADLEPRLQHVAGVRVRLTIFEGTLAAVAQAESVAPFDLEAAPLCRATLVRAAAGSDHGLVVCVPHMVFDGPSAETFLTELAHTCTALQAGSAPTLPAAAWDAQRQAEREADYLNSPAAAAHLEQAVRALRALPAEPVLATRGPIQPGHAFDSASVALVLPVALTSQVNAFARANALSAAAVHLAALQILLWQHSSRAHFGISLPVNCRDSDAVQSAVGYYTNLAVLPARLAAESTAIAHLENVADQLYGLLDARLLPYPELIRAYKAQAGEPFNPDALVGFNYQRTSGNCWDFGEVRARSVPVASGFTKDRIKFDVEETAGEVRCAFEFDHIAYTEKAIGAMLERYPHVLKSMLDTPQVQLDALPANDPAQLHQLLVTWNGARVDYNGALAPHEMVACHAHERPMQVAVMSDNAQLTYQELDTRSSALAQHLLAAGAGPDMPVGVCVARGLDTVVCLLAVLKAGAVYLPLDPACPPARLAFMLRDAAAPVVLTQSDLRTLLPADGIACVLVDGAAGAPPDIRGARAPHRSAGAYCIYTSGSSGTPKGVLVSLGALTEHVLSCVSLYQLTTQDRVLQFASSSFDASIEQMLAPLYAGASLVVRPDRVWSPEELEQVLRERAVSVADIPALYWHHFATQDKPALADTALRLLIIGGEPVRTSGYPRLSRAIRVLNAYGPTEATITATVGELRAPAPGDDWPYAPIGRPLDNTAIYIVNDQLNLVPPGVSGEICIAGPRLARGYLGRPGLTAEHYVPDPFGPPGSRMYRTGDVGRHLPDGSLQYEGRRDQQVKVRGLRTELGEIEQQLLACPDVRNAVVVALDDNSGNKQLVAYVISNSGEAGSAALRAQLGKHLPDYMVPTAWVFLDRLPMNASGKVDRKLLPTPQLRTATAAVDAPDAPLTELEQQVAAVWTQVLKVDPLRATDNFFVLGGHSLLATQIIASLSAQLGMQLTLRILLENPTVGSLAAGIELLRKKSTQAGRVRGLGIRRQRVNAGA